MKRDMRFVIFYKEPRSYWIYRITNESNGWMYIGQTAKHNPFIRWQEHIGHLNRGKHSNPQMQRDYNKTPEPIREVVWTFELIDALDEHEPGIIKVDGVMKQLPQSLNGLETYWMRHHRAEGITLYNVTPGSNR